MEGSYDISSRLVKDRIIFLGSEVEDGITVSIVAQMLLLDANVPEKDIRFYINSPCGSTASGMARFDTMNYIKCDVSTICIGMAASMAAILLAAGEKGKRYALPNARIMIHQPHGGTRGQVTDIEIQAEEMIKTKKLMNKILAERTGKTEKAIHNDTERDYFMSAEEAKAYGLIDEVFINKKK